MQCWKDPLFFTHHFVYAPHLNSLNTWNKLVQITYGLLSKCEDHQDGWILAKFFFACLWTEIELRSTKSQKKRTRPISSHIILTKQAWSIKDLLYGFWENLPCGTWQAVLSGQDSSILPTWLANHSTVFDSSCLLSEQAIK